MSHQEEPRLESYQFTEYGGTPYAPPSPYPPASYSYPPSAPGYPPASYPMPLVQAVLRPKKPIYFPLTRNTSVGKQVVSIVIYSVLMTVLFAGNIAAINLAQENQMPGNVFVHPDGTANGLLFLLAGIFLFLTLPSVTLLSGAFFGAARAFLATFMVVGLAAGLWLVHALLQHIPITIDFNSPGPISFLLLPFTAALVGLFYDRRHSPAWWKSFLILLLGSAFLVTVMLAFVVIFGRPTDTAALTNFYIGIGCVWMLLIPLMTLPIAGIEGIIHAIIAARRKKQNIS